MRAAPGVALPRRRLCLMLPLALAGCSLFRRRRPPPPVGVRYVLGPPYQAGGVWRYPRAQFDYDETGLAQPFAAHGPSCTDGAPYDPTALIAAHPTLQLPCVVQVTNLETGRGVAVRVDDRGPASPARLLALTPRAMALLGPGSTPGVLRVRVQVIEAPSRALADSLPGAPAGALGPALALAAAPAGAVRSESLSPPPGIAAGAPASAGPVAAPSALTAAAAPPPLRLPEQVTQGPPMPGSLFIDLGAFGHPRYARDLAARLAGLGAQASTSYAAATDRPFRVRIGPLASVAEADATLDQALRAGVVDAHIVIDQG